MIISRIDDYFKFEICSIKKRKRKKKLEICLSNVNAYSLLSLINFSVFFFFFIQDRNYSLA